MTTQPRWGIRAEWRKNVERWEPELVVSVQEYSQRYEVAVELRRDDEGPYVVGVAVRPWPYAGGRTDVSPRDVQRLSLRPMINAALAFANTAFDPPDDEGAGTVPAPFHASDWGDYVHATYYDVGHAEEWRAAGFDVPPAMGAAGKVLMPRGRPQRGKSVDFYRELAKSYRELELRGLSPVKEIARRKRVSENTVHQWVHRMRHELGFLEPSPRSRRKEKDDG